MVFAVTVNCFVNTTAKLLAYRAPADEGFDPMFILHLVCTSTAKYVRTLVAIWKCTDCKEIVDWKCKHFRSRLDMFVIIGNSDNVLERDKFTCGLSQTIFLFLIFPHLWQETLCSWGFATSLFSESDLHSSVDPLPPVLYMGGLSSISDDEHLDTTPARMSRKFNSFSISNVWSTVIVTRLSFSRRLFSGTDIADDEKSRCPCSPKWVNSGAFLLEEKSFAVAVIMNDRSTELPRLMDGRLLNSALYCICVRKEVQVKYEAGKPEMEWNEVNEVKRRLEDSDSILFRLPVFLDFSNISLPKKTKIRQENFNGFFGI